MSDTLLPTLHRAFTVLVLVLGVVHIALTPVFFDELAMRTMWYVAQGLMAIFLAFLNLAAERAGWRDRLVTACCLWANGLALAFVVLYAQVDRAIPSWVAIALIAGVAVTALRLSRAPRPH